jgi:hypothetical protein
MAIYTFRRPGVDTSTAAAWEAALKRFGLGDPCVNLYQGDSPEDALREATDLDPAEARIVLANKGIDPEPVELFDIEPDGEDEPVTDLPRGHELDWGR